MPPLLHHYVVVRADVPSGLTGAQIIHAAGESARLAPLLPPGTHAVALALHGEAALVELGRTLAAAGIAHVAVVEDTPPYAGQLLAIGLAPAPKADLKRYLSWIPKLQ